MGNLLAACKFDEDAAPRTPFAERAGALPAATEGGDAGQHGGRAETGERAAQQAEAGVARAGIEADANATSDRDPDAEGALADAPDAAGKNSSSSSSSGDGNENNEGEEARAAQDGDGIPFAQDVTASDARQDAAALASPDALEASPVVKADAPPTSEVAVTTPEKASAKPSKMTISATKKQKKQATKADEIASVASTSSSDKPRRLPSRKASDAVKNASRTVQRVFSRKGKKTKAT